MKNIATTPGARIRALRREKKLTQEKLLTALYMSIESRNTIQDWEKDRILPPLDKLLLLSDIFECDLDFLLCRSDVRNAANISAAARTGLNESALDILASDKDAAALLSFELCNGLDRIQENILTLPEKFAKWSMLADQVKKIRLATAGRHKLAWSAELLDILKAKTAVRCLVDLSRIDLYLLVWNTLTEHFIKLDEAGYMQLKRSGSGAASLPAWIYYNDTTSQNDYYLYAGGASAYFSRADLESDLAGISPAFGAPVVFSGLDDDTVNLIRILTAAIVHTIDSEKALRKELGALRYDISKSFDNIIDKYIDEENKTALNR